LNTYYVLHLHDGQPLGNGIYPLLQGIGQYI